MDAITGDGKGVINLVKRCSSMNGIRDELRMMVQHVK